MRSVFLLEWLLSPDSPDTKYLPSARLSIPSAMITGDFKAKQKGGVETGMMEVRGSTFCDGGGIVT